MINPCESWLKQHIVRRMSGMLCILGTMLLLTSCQRLETPTQDIPGEDLEIQSIEGGETEVGKVTADIEDNLDDTTVSVECTGNVQLHYATQFTAQNYSNGCVYINIEDGNDYVLIPEGVADTNLGYDGATLIHIPAKSTYLAASAAMDMYRVLESLDDIKACSTKDTDYSIEEAVERIRDGRITYVGKYSAPDYEKLLELGCNLAIESTMVYHSPKAKETLESFNIPVLIERSSYEGDPLGRLEWIKLYGMLTGKLDEATEYFDEQVNKVEDIINSVQTGGDVPPSVVFFYVSSNGYVNVRKPGDYISRMIEIAGGEYALKSLDVEEENALSTINISWEDFYAYAKEADILIYNGTIDGGVSDMSELISKNELLADCKAVANNRVYCTNNNMYQETSATGDIIVDLNKIINNDTQNLKYMRTLQP